MKVFFILQFFFLFTFLVFMVRNLQTIRRMILSAIRMQANKNIIHHNNIFVFLISTYRTRRYISELLTIMRTFFDDCSIIDRICISNISYIIYSYIIILFRSRISHFTIGLFIHLSYIIVVVSIIPTFLTSKESHYL